MKLENQTPLPTEVLRECLGDVYGTLITFTKVTYELQGGALSLSREQLPIHKEPCDEAPLGEVHTLWEPGVVDVTVAGDILAPGGEPCTSASVSLAWGDEVRTLRAYGRRVWRRAAGGGLEPSEPEPFLSLPMSWSLAYGGKHVIPAGFAPNTSLPMPSGELPFAPNPDGMGFYYDLDEVEGRPLPHLEDPERLIQSPRDQPRPVCFARLPFASSLRMEHVLFDPETGAMSSRHGESEMTFARFLQRAPPWLQVKGLSAGTRLRLLGMTKDEPMEVTLPEAPVRWLVYTGDRTRARELEIRAIELRPAESKVVILFGCRAFYPLIKHEKRRASLIMTPSGLAQAGIT
jgi:hypothetical protein